MPRRASLLSKFTKSSQIVHNRGTTKPFDFGTKSRSFDSQYAKYTLGNKIGRQWPLTIDVPVKLVYAAKPFSSSWVMIRLQLGISSGAVGTACGGRHHMLDERKYSPYSPIVPETSWEAIAFWTSSLMIFSRSLA